MRRIDGYKFAAWVVAMAAAVGVVLWLSLPAQGTGGQCERFYRHSGHVPAGWTATFYEDGQSYGPYVGPTYVDPETAKDGNRTWDKAIKCRTSTTTTTTSTSTTTTSTTTSTSTTVPGSTTTTENPITTTTETSTTTTPPAPTSTAPTESTTTTAPAPTSTSPDASAEWSAGATCDIITVDFVAGIPAVDVYMWVPESLGDEPPGWEHVARWTEPGDHGAAVSSPTRFLLIPVVQTGYEADPAEIEVTVPVCVASTVAPEPSVVPSDPGDPATPTLPATGFDGLLVPLAFAALGAGVGTLGYARRRWGLKS